MLPIKNAGYKATAAKLALCIGLGITTLAQQTAMTTPASTPVVAASVSPSPTTPAPFISYLKDGALWMMRTDGSENRQLVPAPQESAIANQLWAKDGSRIYFNIGLNISAYLIKEQRIEAVGTLQVPETIAIDRIELGNDDRSILVHTIDTVDALNTVPKVFAVTTTPFQTRELSVDEYHALSPLRSSMIRNVGELSVSPDGKFVLFAEAVEKNIQLFISDIETGSRHQITDLATLEGFEPNATVDGGRKILEATWLPDGRHVVFIPAQSCSEFGLCAGKMYMVDVWEGKYAQLALEPTAAISQEWNARENSLVYDDGGKILFSTILGEIKELTAGNQPRWQPVG